MRERDRGRSAQVIGVPAEEVQVPVGEVVEEVRDAGSGGEGRHCPSWVQDGADPALVADYPGRPPRRSGTRSSTCRGTRRRVPGW
jgi:hypothetical protein